MAGQSHTFVHRGSSLLHTQNFQILNEALITPSHIPGKIRPHGGRPREDGLWLPWGMAHLGELPPIRCPHLKCYPSLLDREARKVQRA